MRLKETSTENMGKALLAIINSSVIAYLINLFSTNNGVSKDDLGHVPIPDPQTLPVAQLAMLTNSILDEKAKLERDFVVKYRARLPEFEGGQVYLPPSAVLAGSNVPKLTMSALVGRGEVRNIGPAGGRIRTLRTRSLITCSIEPESLKSAAFSQILNLFVTTQVRSGLAKGRETR